MATWTGPLLVLVPPDKVALDGPLPRMFRPLSTPGRATPTGRAAGGEAACPTGVAGRCHWRSAPTSRLHPSLRAPPGGCRPFVAYEPVEAAARPGSEVLRRPHVISSGLALHPTPTATGAYAIRPPCAWAASSPSHLTAGLRRTPDRRRPDRAMPSICCSAPGAGWSARRATSPLRAARARALIVHLLHHIPERRAEGRLIQDVIPSRRTAQRPDSGPAIGLNPRALGRSGGVHLARRKGVAHPIEDPLQSDCRAGGRLLTDAKSAVTFQSGPRHGGQIRQGKGSVALSRHARGRAHRWRQGVFRKEETLMSRYALIALVLAVVVASSVASC